MYPEIAILDQPMNDTSVDICVTVANQLRVDALRLLPWINSELWRRTEAKIPGSMNEKHLNGPPLRSGDTSRPSNTTEATMWDAKMDVMSRCKDSV